MTITTPHDSLRVSFPGGKQVLATLGDHPIRTDQPQAHGGEGSAPAPFDLFLASVGTCTGYYVLSFFQSRGLSTEGLEITQSWSRDPESRRITAIELELRVPPEFPMKYHAALKRAADLCSVKRLLADPPAMTTTLRA